VYMSYMSMNRTVEDRAATDDTYRRILEKKARPLLSHGRAMSDDALLAKLRSFGIDADREKLEGLFPRFSSAEAMAKAMVGSAKARVPDLEKDWVWIILTCLWERWQPEISNTEMVDDKMQAGYAALKDRDSPKACRFWLEAWRAILAIMERGGIHSLEAFDDRFGGTQCIFNWVQDMETELHNAGLREPQFFRERIVFCETMIDRSYGGDLLINNFKAALADTHFSLGDRETGDRLFRRWLDEDPRQGNRWIGWSDCYWLFAVKGDKDAARAEQILKAGLATPGVEGRTGILERLAILYEETGRDQEAEAVREELKRLPAPKKSATAARTTEAQVEQILDFGDEGLLLEQLPRSAGSLKFVGSISDDPCVGQPKVGRNELCPCGSGKKFKRCCGARQ
jgi:hypothetical protein